jgi:hypothetical protein
MPLPLSGVISLTDIQTEFGGTNPIELNEYYRGGAFVPNSAPNASIPTSGTISLSNFYGGQKSYAQSAVASYMDANLLNTFRWCNGGDGSYDAFIGGPFARFVSSVSYTASFSLSGASLTGTSKFTVIVGITGSSPSFSSVTVNGTGISVASQADYNQNNEQRTRVLNCTGDFRNLTTVATTWSRVSANSGSWCGVMVVPGHWTVSAIGNIGSYTLAANTLAFMTAYGAGGPDGAIAWVTGNGGMRTKQADSWWYNNGGAGAFVNAGGTARTGSGGGINVNLLALTALTATN